eukprot:3356404-Prymnesium_polylepis.1
MASINDRAEHAGRHHSLLDAVRLVQKSQPRRSSRLANSTLVIRGILWSSFCVLSAVSCARPRVPSTAFVSRILF